ncbi:unnamed protein product [Toxocara canis]|uniref:RING-CH-type domain-containing protein n=1 Tax=Toxocara canis TaxID=6265 RepID=A0A183UKP3_TOXCA|nr:unnamed protein product [Toxocara canis]
MVKLVKSEKNLSEWCVAVVNTSLSTYSLPTESVYSPLHQVISISPSSKDSGIAIDESAAAETANQDLVKTRIADDELPLLTPAQPNCVIAANIPAHLTPKSVMNEQQLHFLGSFVSGRFSTSLSSMGRPLCRICHLVHETPRNPLVAPCRCSGTMQYVHIGCLVHWLEISAKKMYPQPRCELCGYHYKRHPCIDLKRLRSPHIDANDIALNVVFVFAFVVMVICAALCIHFLRVTDQYHSLRVFFRFWLINRNWQIRNYDISDDPEMLVEKLARREKVDVGTNTERCLMLV